MTDGASIYRSIDSGVTWVKTDAPTASWGALASSADGNKLVASVFRTGGIYVWQAVPPEARLTVTQTAAGLVLSWNAPSNAILQQSADLAAESWTAVTLAPTFTNGQYEVTMPPTNRSNFYRLKGS